jgi:hypothetical protein
MMNSKTIHQILTSKNLTGDCIATIALRNRKEADLKLGLLLAAKRNNKNAAMVATWVDRSLEKFKAKQNNLSLTSTI